MTLKGPFTKLLRLLLRFLSKLVWKHIPRYSLNETIFRFNEIFYRQTTGQFSNETLGTYVWHEVPFRVHV